VLQGICGHLPLGLPPLLETLEYTGPNGFDLAKSKVDGTEYMTTAAAVIGGLQKLRWLIHEGSLHCQLPPSFLSQLPSTVQVRKGAVFGRVSSKMYFCRAVVVMCCCMLGPGPYLTTARCLSEYTAQSEVVRKADAAVASGAGRHRHPMPDTSWGIQAAASRRVQGCSATAPACDRVVAGRRQARR
jgi:hypothetical protein